MGVSAWMKALRGKKKKPGMGELQALENIRANMDEQSFVLNNNFWPQLTGRTPMEWTPKMAKTYRDRQKAGENSTAADILRMYERAAMKNTAKYRKKGQ